MPSNTTRVVTVRLPIAWYAQIQDIIASDSADVPYQGDLPQDTGVSEWIRRAVKEVIGKRARSAASRERAAERALAAQEVIPYVPPVG